MGFGTGRASTNGPGQPVCEGCRHIFADFKATWPNAGAEGGCDEGGVDAGRFAQGIDRACDDTSERATPARVGNGDGGSVARCKKEGRTIGSAYHKCNSRRESEECIGAQRRMWGENALGRKGGFIHLDDIRSMQEVRGDGA